MWCAVLALLAASGCARVEPVEQRIPAAPEQQAAPETPPEPRCAAARRPVEQGAASWYGETHHGRRTASGAAFDMNGMTAAHRTLPFGTRIRVTHAGTGRSVVLTVTDRGPFVEGRIVDVSRQAARELGFEQDGVAPVRLAVTGPC
ncbi:MAG: septal ring lytic transglycosylase RlpA family protein [Alphaproteobacteria bacterium]